MKTPAGLETPRPVWGVPAWHAQCLGFHYPELHEPGVVVHTCDLNIQEGETGGSDSRGHLLLSEAEGNLGCSRVCFRHGKQNTILGPTLPARRLAGCW